MEKKKRKNPSRKGLSITAYKGGRTIKRSTDVTPDVYAILKKLWQKYRISLGDLVEEAAYRKVKELEDETPDQH